MAADLAAATVLVACPGGVRVSPVLWAAPRALSGQSELPPGARNWPYANDKLVTNSCPIAFSLTVAVRSKSGRYVHLRRTLHATVEPDMPMWRLQMSTRLREMAFSTVLGRFGSILCEIGTPVYLRVVIPHGLGLRYLSSLDVLSTRRCSNPLGRSVSACCAAARFCSESQFAAARRRGPLSTAEAVRDDPGRSGYLRRTLYAVVEPLRSLGSPCPTTAISRDLEATRDDLEIAGDQPTLSE